MDDSEGVQSASVMAHPTPENFLALLVAAGLKLQKSQTLHPKPGSCGCVHTSTLNPEPEAFNPGP